MVAEGHVEGVVRNEALDEPYVGPLGSGSDFTVFLQYLGIASSNVGYARKRTDPGASFLRFCPLLANAPAVYHYHSIYDSAYW